MRKIIRAVLAAAAVGSAVAAGAQNSENVEEEVIVTAQKRPERLQDVPVPVTAVQAQALVSSNQLGIQDYYTRVPGLAVAPGIQSTQSMSLRGITTGRGNPTVGVTVDDLPYGTSTGLQIPDIDPNDLARIEVLRGPQGTLYGASSMGGLLKFVTIDPSTEAFSGRIQTGTSVVSNGDDMGYNVRGAVNVPLSDAFAIRLSGFHREDAGYIDNPMLGTQGVNRQTVNGGLVSALFVPSDAFSLKLSALYQDAEGDASSDVTILPGLSDLEQNYVRGAGEFDREIQAYSAVLNAKLGSVNLTALTGYNVYEFSDSFDFSSAASGLTELLFGASGAPILNGSKNTKFTQEVRLSIPIGDKLEWVAGAFYTDEDKPFSQTILATDSLSGAVAGEVLFTTFPTTYKEYAAFTNLTYELTDRFDIQIGGRYSKIEQTYNSTYVGPYVPLALGQTSPYTVPEERSTAEPLTYLVTPRFRISPDLMVYARFASGYRAGGPNQVVEGVPSEYQPDETKNYEVGIKGNLFEQLLTFDASIYYVDWKDIQLSLVSPQSNQSYTGNAGGAKSQGIELSLQAMPTDRLDISAWVAWGEADLKEGFPITSSAYGVEGDRLPYSSRFSGNLSVSQEFSLTGSVTGVLGASVSYIGDRKDLFGSRSAPQRQDLPAYAKTDMNAGIRYDSWTVNLFVNNLTDRRGVLGGGIGNYIPFAFNYIQPRTLGVSLSKTF